MFAYVDPTIRERLTQKGQLFCIDPRGEVLGDECKAGEHEFTLNVLGPIPLPIDVGEHEISFDWYTFVRHTELVKAREIGTVLTQRGDKRLMPLLSSYMSVNSALVYGELAKTDKPLVRVHSSCLTGDIFGSKRCECGPQLSAALYRIVQDESGAGVLVYMAGHEGRGIGLWAKAITYLLQDAGEDTYQANRSLGLPEDSRDFGDSAAILLFLLGGDRPFRLLTNNPKKQQDLATHGLNRFSVVKHVAGINQYNRRYLLAKRQWGHYLDVADFAYPPTEDEKT